MSNARRWMSVRCDRCSGGFYWSRAEPRDPPAEGAEVLCEACSVAKRAEAEMDGFRSKLDLAIDEVEMLRSIIRDAREALGPAWTKRMSLPERIAAKVHMLESSLAIAAERDRNLSNHNDEMRDALLLARDAIDQLMGDSDLAEDDSVEQRAMRAIARVLERGRE